MASTSHAQPTPPANKSAALDSAHVGNIEGAFGTILVGDDAPRTKLSAKLRTLLAIVGPGLIVMVGDNDAGAFGTYTQAGQNYGTSLLCAHIFPNPCGLVFFSFFTGTDMPDTRRQ